MICICTHAKKEVEPTTTPTAAAPNTVTRTHRSDKETKSKINQVHTHTHRRTEKKRNQAYYKTIILSVSVVVVDRTMVFALNKNQTIRASLYLSVCLSVQVLCNRLTYERA